VLRVDVVEVRVDEQPPSQQALVLVVPFLARLRSHRRRRRLEEGGGRELVAVARATFLEHKAAGAVCTS
jgi:hypothetical protein